MDFQFRRILAGTGPALLIAGMTFSLYAGEAKPLTPKGEDRESHEGHDHAEHEDEGKKKDADKNDEHAGHDHAAHEGEEHTEPKDGDKKKDADKNDEHAAHEGHGDEDEGKDADPHAGHDHGAHEDEGTTIAPDIMKKIGLKVVEAKRGRLINRLTIPGEVRLNEGQVVHVTPRVGGIVKDVFVNVGHKVSKGDVMAVLESSDLARAKGEYLAQVVREEFARKQHDREKQLWSSKIGAEADYLAARQGLAEATIQLRFARQRLLTIGFTSKYINELAEQPEEVYMRYGVLAPADGIIIRKHLSRGEARKDEDEIFVIANLDTVWIDLAVYQKNIPYIREGVKARISAGESLKAQDGVISMVSPVAEEKARTVLARIVLPNKGGTWVPGMFVTAEIEVPSDGTVVLVEKDAPQNIEGEAVVFVVQGDGFKTQPVKLGRSDENHTEVLSGLVPGQKYVAEGAFDLKAQMITSGMDAHAGHGH